MSIKLLELPTEKLLEKIGAGNHKPGSGSAAAFNAILACKLLLTVIHLTLEPKRRKRYQHCLDKCRKIEKDIDERIVPKLEELFQIDSEQFDKVIVKRRERNNESNQARKNQLDKEARQELVQSTELPLQIARLSIELSDYAIYIFDHGFKSARGDSGVALSSALSSVTGCISIVSLNLQSFPKSDWTDKINSQKASMRNKYHRLTKEKNKRLDILDKEAEQKSDFLAKIQDIRKSLHGKSKISYNQVESLAKRIQNVMWTNREIIWKDGTPSNLIEILKPAKAINLLQYAFREVHTLGVNEANQEIAGLIDNKNYEIAISGMYSQEIKNFTTAHELGHALMHDQLVLHRDRPRDQPDITLSRPTEERQADKFAAYFLLPEKLLRQKFKERFQTDRLYLNEETSFALGYNSVPELKKKVKDLRGLTRLIASTTIYASSPFRSLSDIFNVSFEAMAIRLEELDLVRLHDS